MDWSRFGVYLQALCKPDVLGVLMLAGVLCGGMWGAALGSSSKHILWVACGSFVGALLAFLLVVMIAAVAAQTRKSE